MTEQLVIEPWISHWRWQIFLYNTWPIFPRHFWSPLIHFIFIWAFSLWKRHWLLRARENEYLGALMPHWEARKKPWLWFQHSLETTSWLKRCAERELLIQGLSYPSLYPKGHLQKSLSVSDRMTFIANLDSGAALAQFSALPGYKMELSRLNLSVPHPHPQSWG